MKNLGLEPATGFADGTGDWNKLTGLPPPLLNVSTYLKSFQIGLLLDKGEKEFG